MSSSTERAAAYLVAFEKQRDADLLDQAADQLLGIVLASEPDPVKRRALRGETLVLWLRLFALIDAAWDAGFDPGDFPEVSAQPPSSGGVTFPPGVDPSVIKDPIARTEYERRIAENTKKTLRYNLQIKLRRLDAKLEPDLDRFLRASYAREADDRREVEQSVYALIRSPERAARLRGVLAP